MKSNRPVTAFFDRGQIPTISCVYSAATKLPDSYKGFDNLIATLQRYANECLAPVWGTPCKLVVDTKVQRGNWGFVFLDNSDVAQALGYHDLTADGFPLSQMFVETTMNDGEEVSVTASHELAEMLLDPAVQLGAQGPGNTWYAYELCDPVESLSFNLNGIPMSDFVYPSWFEGFRRPNSTQFDYMKRCTRPFQIQRGGYMPIYRNGRWSQVFANKTDAKKFVVENHPRLMLRKRISH